MVFIAVLDSSPQIEASSACYDIICKAVHFCTVLALLQGADQKDRLFPQVNVGFVLDVFCHDLYQDSLFERT